MANLNIIENYQDIQNSFNIFKRDASKNDETTKGLLTSITYWVYDCNTKTFGPSKFIGFKDMTFEKYRSAKADNCKGLRFNANNARDAIARILGPYTKDSELSERFRQWGESLCGPSVFRSIKKDKWLFTML